MLTRIPAAHNTRKFEINAPIENKMKINYNLNNQNIRKN